MRVLRHEGLPAVISGAGPSVVVLDGDRSRISSLVRHIVTDPADWRIAECRCECWRLHCDRLSLRPGGIVRVRTLQKPCSAT